MHTCTNAGAASAQKLTVVLQMLPLHIQLLSDRCLIDFTGADQSDCSILPLQAGGDSLDSPLLFQIYRSQINLSSPRAVIFGLNFLSPDIFRRSAIIQVIRLKLGRKGRLVCEKGEAKSVSNVRFTVNKHVNDSLEGGGPEPSVFARA